jgi:flagellar biogenesis protein FliO
VLEPWHIALLLILLVIALIWLVVRTVRRSMARRRT